MTETYALGYYKPGNPYRRARLSTVDLLVLTSLDQLVFTLKILFASLQNKLAYRIEVVADDVVDVHECVDGLHVGAADMDLDPIL